MSDVAHPDQPIRLPNVSYGPFRLLKAVPWLMLATALRFIRARLGPLGGPLAIAAWHAAIFLAFLLAARRMIELTDGHTELGALSFRQRLELTRKVREINWTRGWASIAPPRPGTVVGRPITSPSTNPPRGPAAP